MSAEARRRRHLERRRAFSAGVTVAELRLAHEAVGMLRELGAPPLIILVSGGKVSPDAAQRIRDYLAKPRDNFHSILILEPTHRVELEPGLIRVTVGKP